jgi:hypothetical protein
MATIAMLLSEPKSDDWAPSACDYFLSITEEQLRDATLRPQLLELIQAAYEDCDFVHCYLSSAQDVEDMLGAAAEAGRPPTPRPAEPELLPPASAAKPAVVVKPLPEPMSAATKKLVLGGFTAPQKPTDHGCAYFDGAPWDICYACEYEKNPSSYYNKVRKSELVMLLSAYFKDARIGEQFKDWHLETLEEIYAYLDTPVAERGEPPRALRFLKY